MKCQASVGAELATLVSHEREHQRLMNANIDRRSMRRIASTDEVGAPLSNAAAVTRFLAAARSRVVAPRTRPPAAFERRMAHVLLSTSLRPSATTVRSASHGSLSRSTSPPLPPCGSIQPPRLLPARRASSRRSASNHPRRPQGGRRSRATACAVHPHPGSRVRPVRGAVVRRRRRRSTSPRCGELVRRPRPRGDRTIGQLQRRRRRPAPPRGAPRRRA